MGLIPFQISSMSSAESTKKRRPIRHLNEYKSHPLTKLTRASKVHDLDSTTLRVAQQYVFWFEIAVDDTEFWSGKKEEGGAELLSELACEIQRDASEVGVPQ